MNMHNELPDSLKPQVMDRRVKTGYCKEPCNGCPWRTDTAMSIIPETERLCGSDAKPLMPDEPMMPCHKEPDDECDQNLCAGWLALYGLHHLGVRIMAARGLIPGDALYPKPDWPELHPDVQSIIEAHGEPQR